MSRRKEEGIQPDVIVVNPPRKGHDFVHYKERDYIVQYVQPLG